MNELVVSRCRSQGLEVTPSRAYRKNDQVEQKNGAIVRRLVGYGRFVAEVTAALVRLYDAVRLHVNLFRSSGRAGQVISCDAKANRREFIW